MDAPENELDVKLHRVSGELIAAFDDRLRPFLRKPDGAGGHRVRSRVRARETGYLMSNLLDPFQELPQLLDPHLPKWLPMLAEAFLEYLQTRRRRAREAAAANALLMPLPTAVCKLIYSFCKLRGEKVIVRFLNVETKYLELLLTALEDAERHQASDHASPHWTWEERYVVLLWLSHLMYAPFDLSTISSIYMEDIDLAGVPGFFWPSNVPGIAVRVLPLAFKYLACPSKERDAAKALLVRMAMRRDMQKLGVLHALVQWALFWLRPNAEQTLQSPYKYIGVLSFLAGILASSAETSDMDKYSSTIFYTVNALSSHDGELSHIVTSSALAKKMIIKVIRSIAVSRLKRSVRDLASIELIETTIGYLLNSLADNDTPVRLAASKALSIVTLSLPDYMASEVVEAVLESLNRNVLWADKAAGHHLLAPARDLTSVDPLEWHGLMLTLSHLLYRRSPPAEKLGSIIRALLLGLSFERRSPSGTSTGSNVRDAACFGVWALARRYSTKELLAVSPEAVQGSKSGRVGTSVLQILATDLVVTASLDSAGNIRRGSSAALQELIGRHPDTVAEGIAVVQTVDYHAVALRSRAIHDVAVHATKLHLQYGDTILEALLGWRGTGDPDVAARRVAALSYGSITAERSSLFTSENLDDTLLGPVTRVYSLMQALQTRQVEERHGLLLALAATIDHTPSILDRRTRAGEVTGADELASIVESAQIMLATILKFTQSTTFRKPDLIAEGICRLFISFFPFFQARAFGYEHAVEENRLVSGTNLVATVNMAGFAKIVSSLDVAAFQNQETLLFNINVFAELVSTWLTRSEPAVLSAASEASLILLTLCPEKQRDALVNTWSSSIRISSSRAGVGAGYFQALTKSYSILSIHETAEVAARRTCEPLLERWAQDTDVDVRVAILQSLTQGEVLAQNVDQLLGMVAEGLEDYKTNARGDVGSHVRLQAIKATKYLWGSSTGPMSSGNGSKATVAGLLRPILRLAAEKLDRVRAEAQSTLALALADEPFSRLQTLTFSSQTYFTFLLGLLTSDSLREAFRDVATTDSDKWMDELLAGYVTSADTGNEDLVIASRAALTEYCHTTGGGEGGEGGGPAGLDRVCASLLRNLKARQGQDRVVVPTLEMIAFLFSVGIYQRSTVVDFKSLCLQVQRAGYKSGNVRKLEACVKIYGGLVALVGGLDLDQSAAAGGLIRTTTLTPMATDALEQKRREGVREARKRLGALAIHPWPRVRSSVVDALWGLVLLATAAGGGDGDGDAGGSKADKLKGVDWGTADKGAVKKLVADLGLC